MENTRAIWGINLWADCPACKESVDLLEYEDFWDGRVLDIGEHDTERSKNVEVTCTECYSDFIVDLEY